MKLIPDTIAGRTIAVLLVGFLVFHAISICAYQIGVDNEVDLTNEIRVAERLFTIKRALASLPPAEREKTAHSLSGGPIEVHWSNVPLTVENTRDEDTSRGLRRRLLELAPDLGSTGLRVGVPSASSGRTDDPHLVLVSMKLADDSWANFSLTKLSGARTTLANVVLTTSLMALGVVVLLIVILRSVTRPIRQCAAAAQQIYVNAEPHPITVSGPREVRDLAVAFNALQQRVKRLVDDRTLMLAAISHDLKTPLTRAQLRIENIEDRDMRRDIDADLHEMLMMVDSTLQFIKGDQNAEVFNDIELTAVIESICNDLSDLGFTVSFVPECKIVLRGRHLALKRAFNNLIVNAVSYGRQARVVVARGSQRVEVMIDDDGPGIPVEHRETVFAPFYRLESSRNRDTGGTGLGLTVARTIIRGHGGDVTLHDSPSGGLRVRVTLPIAQQSSFAAK